MRIRRDQSCDGGPLEFESDESNTFESLEELVSSTADITDFVCTYIRLINLLAGLSTYRQKIGRTRILECSAGHRLVHGHLSS